MSRRTLTDGHERVEWHLPGRVEMRGHSGVDNRLFVDAILWMAGSWTRWRDLPDVFGKRSGVHARLPALMGLVHLACAMIWPR